MNFKNLFINSLFLIAMIFSSLKYVNSIKLKNSQIFFTSNNYPLSYGNFTKCEFTFDDYCYLEGLSLLKNEINERYGMVKNELYYTASHGNFNETAKVNETILQSQSQRVCRMNNSTNLVVLDMNQSMNCTKENFQVNVETNCECSLVYKPNWDYCSKENIICNKTGLIRYGNNGSYIYNQISKQFVCDATTFGNTGQKENYCWKLNKTNPIKLKAYEKLEISEEYRTCDLINNDSIISSKILNPFSEFTCSNANFGNLSTDLNNCVCYSYIN